MFRRAPARPTVRCPRPAAACRRGLGHADQGDEDGDGGQCSAQPPHGGGRGLPRGDADHRADRVADLHREGGGGDVAAPQVRGGDLAGPGGGGRGTDHLADRPDDGRDHEHGHAGTGHVEVHADADQADAQRDGDPSGEVLHVLGEQQLQADDHGRVQREQGGVEGRSVAVGLELERQRGGVLDVDDGVEEQRQQEQQVATVAEYGQVRGAVGLRVPGAGTGGRPRADEDQGEEGEAHRRHRVDVEHQVVRVADEQGAEERARGGAEVERHAVDREHHDVVFLGVASTSSAEEAGR